MKSAEYYAGMAEECRTIAGILKDRQASNAMHCLADQYAALALLRSTHFVSDTRARAIERWRGGEEYEDYR